MRTFTFAPEESSNVRQIGYDPQLQIFRVVFGSDESVAYEYEGVPAHVAAQVTYAESVGAAVRARLVNGGYKTNKTTNA
jgi:hypothetical protein